MPAGPKKNARPAGLGNLHIFLRHRHINPKRIVRIVPLRSLVAKITQPSSLDEDATYAAKAI